MAVSETLTPAHFNFCLKAINFSFEFVTLCVSSQAWKENKRDNKRFDSVALALLTIFLAKKDLIVFRILFVILLFKFVYICFVFALLYDEIFTFS